MIAIPNLFSYYLNNGKKIPIIGLGTWQAAPEEVKEAVEYAIDCGYRHFDTAYFYQNESGVGAAIKKKIQDGVIKREDVFVTSKLWCNSMKTEMVEAALLKTLKNLDLEYLDLYLIHWPMAFKEGEDLYPLGPDGKLIFSSTDYVETWKGMEMIYKKGLSKSIGVSNFNKRQLERLLETATVVPVTNQIECHPYLTQNKLIDLCKENNILVTAYSPLGSPGRNWATSDEPVLIEDPKIKEMSSKYEKTPAQICLRYLIQKGVVPIPKSSNKNRIEENFDLFDFQLNTEEMDQLNSLGYQKRYHNHDIALGHKEHPFENDEY